MGCNASLILDPVQIRIAIYTPECIDVEDASTASGAHLLLFGCGNGKMSQEWAITPQGSGEFNTVMNENSKMCMSVSALPNNQGFGEAVIQATCNKSDPDMLWEVVADKAANAVTGTAFVNEASGQCLDLPYGAVDAPDTLPLQQYECTGTDPAQVWNINPVQMGNIP